MTPLEAVLLAVSVVVLAARWRRPRHRQTAASALAMVGIFFLLHLVFDGPRWEMIPTYAMVVAAAVILGGDLKRLATARAGESAKFRAVRSSARRAASGVALALAAAVAVVLPALLFPRVTFARPGGPYPVGRVDVYWVDSTREETLGGPAGAKRGLLVSIWYPAEPPARGALRYHPDPLVLASDAARRFGLPGFTFWNLALARTHSAPAPAFNSREGRSPLLLFSHGYGGSRVQNTFEFEQIASQGYVIASIEHPYAARGTVLPGGRHVPLTADSLVRTGAGRLRLLDIWTADTRFVLDRLTSGRTHDAADTVTAHLQPDRIGVFGHSFGGATAAEALARDPRVKAGIDMDGLPQGASAAAGLDRPFLVFRSAQPDPDSVADAVLRRRYGGISRDSLRRVQAAFTAGVNSLLQYGGTEIRMDGTSHVNFTDLPLWSPFLLRREGLLGSDDPVDVHRAVTALTLRFFDQYLRGRAPDQAVPIPPRVQVQVVRHESRVR